MSRAQPPRVRRWALVAAASLWCCTTFLWVGALMYERDTIGTTSCPLAPGSSTFGEASWGWLPPGKTCTWTFTEGVGDVMRLERTPPPARILTAVVLLLWGLTLLALGPRRRGMVAGISGDEPQVGGAGRPREAAVDLERPPGARPVAPGSS